MNAGPHAAGVAGPVRFELPFDVGSDGRLTRGTLLVTDRELVAVAGGRTETIDLDRVSAIKVEALTYGGRVLAHTDGGPAVVAQYSARLAARYREAARALASFLHRRGAPVRPVGGALRPATGSAAGRGAGSWPGSWR